MADNTEKKPIRAISPSGEPLTLENLPDPKTKRWVVRRKAEVVAAVRGGLLSLEEACERYQISVEEFESWRRLVEKHGLRGLRVTRLQDYRQTSEANIPGEAIRNGNGNGEGNSNGTGGSRTNGTDHPHYSLALSANHLP